jgi:hypothetical protein
MRKALNHQIKTPVCCEIYMKKQSVRIGPSLKMKPVSHICLICGKIILDPAAFEEIRIKEAIE